MKLHEKGQWDVFHCRHNKPTVDAAAAASSVTMETGVTFSLLAFASACSSNRLFGCSRGRTTALCSAHIWNSFSEVLKKPPELEYDCTAAHNSWSTFVCMHEHTQTKKKDKSPWHQTESLTKDTSSSISDETLVFSPAGTLDDLTVLYLPALFVCVCPLAQPTVFHSLTFSRGYLLHRRGFSFPLLLPLFDLDSRCVAVDQHWQALKDDGRWKVLL